MMVDEEGEEGEEEEDEEEEEDMVDTLFAPPSPLMEATNPASVADSLPTISKRQRRPNVRLNEIGDYTASHINPSSNECFLKRKGAEGIKFSPSVLPLPPPSPSSSSGERLKHIPKSIIKRSNDDDFDENDDDSYTKLALVDKIGGKKVSKRAYISKGNFPKRHQTTYPRSDEFNHLHHEENHRPVHLVEENSHPHDFNHNQCEDNRYPLHDCEDNIHPNEFKARPLHHSQGNHSHRLMYCKNMSGVTDGFLEAADGASSDTEKRTNRSQRTMSNHDDIQLVGSSFAKDSLKVLGGQIPSTKLTKTKTKINPKARTKPNANIKTKTNVESKIKTIANANVNIKTKSNVKTKTSASAKTMTVTKTRNRSSDVPKDIIQSPPKDEVEQREEPSRSDVQERQVLQHPSICVVPPPPLDDKVRDWLKRIGLDKYSSVFQHHEVTNDVFPLLTMDDLKEMGISAIGSRRKLFSEIMKLRQSLRMLVDESLSDGK